MTKKGWDELIDEIIDEYCFEFGWKNIKERWKHLRDYHKLELPTPDPAIDLLEKATHLRDVFVHNGGRISAKYLEHCPEAGALGAQLPISLADVDKVAFEVQLAGADLFCGVARKFFSPTEADYRGVWQRPKPTHI